MPPGGARINPKVKICEQCDGEFTRAPAAKFCTDCLPSDQGQKQAMRWRQNIRLYGVDKTMWDSMYFEQGGSCAICQEREATCIDHDHETGRVRGLLCLGCNTMLGFIETPGRLDAALSYIKDGKY